MCECLLVSLSNCNWQNCLLVSASSASPRNAVIASTIKMVDKPRSQESKERILERLRVMLRVLKMTFSFAISFLRVGFVTEAIVLPLVTHSNTFSFFG